MVTITRILCPIDFSEFSRHALIRASAIAKAHGASITAVHIVPLQPRFSGTPLEFALPVAFELTAVQREHLHRELAEFVRSATGSTPIDTEVAEAPTVHGEILAQAARLHADLIVMGTHGRSGFERLLLGSITEKVLRTALQPVLTVGALTEDDRDASSFARVVCAIDFSKCSIAGLHYALALAEGSGARVTAVNVMEWPPAAYDPLIGPPTDLVGYHMSAEAAARKRLHEIVVDAGAKGVEVEEIVTSGKPHHEILKVAETYGSDLIVLGIHGRNPVDRMLFGSTAEPLVRRATCPVLTVRAGFAAKMAAA
jgi:nucleotide-binding universal stress UspA family protein